MTYTVEFIRFVDGRAEPAVVTRMQDEFSSVEESKTQAVVAFATTSRNVVGYRVVKDGREVVTTVIRGLG